MYKLLEHDPIVEAVAIVFAEAAEVQQRQIAENLNLAYSDPLRGHHNSQHIAEMLAEAKKHAWKDRASVIAAILYHDIIYEPLRYKPGFAGTSNEEASAQRLEESLTQFGIDRSLIQRAACLIRMTEKHDTPHDDVDAALLMDIDMWVIGSGPKRYAQYARGVAKEFLQIYTPMEYKIGRTKFLIGLVNSERPIFKTQVYSALEAQAKENMRWELENLTTLVPATMNDRNPAP